MGRLMKVVAVCVVVAAMLGAAVEGYSSSSGYRPRPRRVQCQSRNYRYRYCRSRYFICPPHCPYSCSVNCVTCRPVCDCDRPGAVCQDPRFIGADGLTFYFHGKKDSDFCLVADSNLHINAHFIGRRNPTMGRDFTWVQSLGILFNNHKLSVGAMKTATWMDSVDRLALSFDGEPVYLLETAGDTWNSTYGDVSITRLEDTNSVEIEAEGQFKIKAVVVPISQKESLIHNYGVTDDDCFAHLDLTFKFYSLTAQVNGVLGQTYADGYVSRVKMGISMPVLGGEKEFASSALFSPDCSVARYVGKRADDSDLGVVVGGDLTCAGGDGPGVVCKR
ncbi:hypothetical protein V2J09_002752 [Rumex salicifolius]